MLEQISQRVNTKPLDEFLNDPTNARILRGQRPADLAIARYEDPDETKKQNDIMMDGLCPYCKTTPAPRWGEPCEACRDQLEEEMNQYSRKARII